MYEKILVTLDQSDLAERALPHAVNIARAFESTVHLVSVVAVVDGEATGEVGVSVDWQARVDRARDYMGGIRRRILGEGVEAEWDVCRGDVAEEILRYSQQQECDLIVMCTHGRSGLGRWVYGSVADRILRHAEAPVLLVRAVDPE